MENENLMSKILEENSEYIDSIATDVMKSYISTMPPSSFNDSMIIARLAYRQAVAMLKVKLFVLPDMLEKSDFVTKKKEDEL